MKVCKEVVEVSDKGLEALIGENVEIWCGVYIYAGRLIGVNAQCIKLANPHIVYETGAHDAAQFQDAQSLNRDFHYVSIGAIESFGVTTKL